jgi:aerobic-type carbon monoxide dehydrogenase small subunit (CoxS/CutS family)
MMTTLVVNGRTATVPDPPQTPLLWVLRDSLGLPGTKYGCGRGQCGACTVTLDGQALRSCVLPVSAATGKQVVTIEGLASGDRLHRLQRAWIEHRVSQCGYCQAGMLMQASALLQRTPKPTEAQVREGITNLCRCGSYPRIVRAVLAAAETA